MDGATAHLANHPFVHADSRACCPVQLCQEIEKKAVLVREQQAEFQRVQLAYAQARCHTTCQHPSALTHYCADAHDLSCQQTCCENGIFVVPNHAEGQPVTSHKRCHRCQLAWRC